MLVKARKADREGRAAMGGIAKGQNNAYHGADSFGIRAFAHLKGHARDRIPTAPEC